jgi:chromosomal replication initiator protein
MAAFRHKFRDVDVLVIDDIHFLAKRDRTQEEFFHTFNSLYQAHKQIVLSSDAPPEDIPDLEERLVSRFKWGLVANVDAPGYETRVAIVKQKARLRGLELPEEAACLIAARIESNIRELEGAVVKLQMIASVEGRAPDLEMTRQALGEEPGRVEKPLQIQVITNVVTDFYGVKITDLQSKRRHRSVALPRQVCMFLARRMTLLSLEQIGGFFGGRDHTTVMHAIRTVEEKCSQDGEFAVTIRSLEERVRASAT